MSIKSILIVGGGTAGWMSAVYLNRMLNAAFPACEITLVESPETPTVGVGEATVPTLLRFLSYVGIDHDHFMERCDATYKIAIKFADWLKGDDAYWHPFGPCGGTIDGIHTFHFWLKRRLAGESAEKFSVYSLHALLSEMQKSPRPEEGSSLVMDHGEYAFHLDAEKFAELLREHGTGLGVRHVRDHVEDVSMGENGMIRAVRAREHGEMEADLYIDCTGFRGLLIREAMEEPFLSWAHYLPCDRAAVQRMPRAADAPVNPYTIASAREAGWIWDIPLRDRYGRGYVFSSDFSSEEDAARCLSAYTGSEDDIRFLRFQVGRMRDVWKGNCISIGLAAGFLEPLESTGIFLIQRALEELEDCFPHNDFDEKLTELYNLRMARHYEEVRDFIVLHYALTRRDDTEFWQSRRDLGDAPDSARELLDTYLRTTLVETRATALFRDGNYYSIFAGMECLPEKAMARMDFFDAREITAILSRIITDNLNTSAKLPANLDYINSLRTAAKHE